MLFNSYIFLFIFFPSFLLLWFGLGTWTSLRMLLLVVASYLFYGWNRWEFTFLLAGSTVIDYYVGNKLNRSTSPAARIAWLSTSLISNLGILAYFKYVGFFAESYNAMVEFLHTGHAIHVPDVALPVGISFYTFQTLSYSIDIYRRQVAPAKSFLHFAAYVSMFPQLIAGPIVRYRDIEDQLNRCLPTVRWDYVSVGIWFFVVGMSQKILIADALAREIQPLLAEPTSLQLWASWYALLGYSGQLYFDFAGYSNMAIGLGYILGFIFPANFNSPYKAISIQDFWRRWHITLSTFLRDYLYIPLGGNRVQGWLSMRNLVLVMFLGGLWHGAGWTFVVWGLYHGVLLAIHALYKAHSPYRLPQPVAICVTFLAVCLGWLIFRSDDLSMAGHWCWAILGGNGVELSLSDTHLAVRSFIVLGIAFGIVWLFPNANQFRPKQNLITAVALAGLLVCCILRLDVESPFLYFQF